MRDTVEYHPETAQLKGMDGMVEVVVAQELVFLDPDRREHGDRSHPLGGQVGQAERYPATHAEPNQVSARHAQRIQQLTHVAGMRANRVIGDARAGPAEAGKVRGQNPVSVRQRPAQCDHLAIVPGAAVEQHHHGRGREPGCGRIEIGQAYRISGFPFSIDRVY